MILIGLTREVGRRVACQVAGELECMIVTWETLGKGEEEEAGFAAGGFDRMLLKGICGRKAGHAAGGFDRILLKEILHWKGGRRSVH